MRRIARIVLSLITVAFSFVCINHAISDQKVMKPKRFNSPAEQKVVREWNAAGKGNGFLNAHVYFRLQFGQAAV